MQFVEHGTQSFPFALLPRHIIVVQEQGVVVLKVTRMLLHWMRWRWMLLLLMVLLLDVVVRVMIVVMVVMLLLLMMMGTMMWTHTPQWVASLRHRHVVFWLNLDHRAIRKFYTLCDSWFLPLSLSLSPALPGDDYLVINGTQQGSEGREKRTKDD